MNVNDVEGEIGSQVWMNNVSVMADPHILRASFKAQVCYGH